MKKLTSLTLSSIFIFSSLHANGAMTRENFSCQIQGEALEQGINSFTRYSRMDLSFLNDSSGKTQKMNIILRGQRTRKINVGTVDTLGNTGDSTSSNGKIISSAEPTKDKYEIQTIISDTEENLTFDPLTELLEQQYQYAEASSENFAREQRNEKLKREYREKKLQYEENLRDQTMASHLMDKPMKAVYNPDEPKYESMLPLPQGPINLSFDYKQYANARNNPKSTLKVVLNNASIAALECIQTPNLVDHKSNIESDVKGLYNKGGGKTSASKQQDYRAKGMGAFAMPLPTINRMDREMWCLKKTLVGTVNLEHFNKGAFKVNCEYSGSEPSDN